MHIITSDSDHTPATAFDIALATVEDELAPDPLMLLIELEERLMAEHGMTFMQAVKAGVDAINRKRRD